MTDLVLIDGVPLESELLYLQFEGFGDLFSTAALRGSNHQTPLRDGEAWRRKVRSATEFTLRFALASTATDKEDAAAEVQAEWFRLLRMFPRRRPVVVTRPVTVATAYGRETIHQNAVAEMVDAITPTWRNYRAHTGIITLRNMNGVWWSEDRRAFTVESEVSTFIPVGGSTDTHDLSVELFRPAGGGVQRVENVSAGVWFELDWGQVSAGVTAVDVNAFTFVVAGWSGGSYYAQGKAFTHGGDERFMVLDPTAGDNELLLTGGGSALLQWRDAWS